MKKLIPINDKVIGKSVDDYGLKTTAGGLIINEKDGVPESIRPRWFEVTHVGPKNIDFKIGDFVLVAHGRWSRGFTINDDDDTKYFHLDSDEIMLISDTKPNL